MNIFTKKEYYSFKLREKMVVEELIVSLNILHQLVTPKKKKTISFLVYKHLLKKSTSRSLCWPSFRAFTDNSNNFTRYDFINILAWKIDYPIKIFDISNN